MTGASLRSVAGRGRCSSSKRASAPNHHLHTGFILNATAPRDYSRRCAARQRRDSGTKWCATGERDVMVQTQLLGTDLE
ncbi:unnamed protein product [Arctogadus glacialis]